jgi:hypothetical protein
MTCAGHAAAEVSTGVAFDANRSGPHTGTDPVDATEVTLEHELQV